MSNHEPLIQQRWLTVPNILTLTRIVASPLMIMLAARQSTAWLIALIILLVATELFDGVLARALHQETSSGARLDSIADASFYGSLGFTVAIVQPALIFSETAWISLAIGAYALSWIVSWIKFRRIPSYHTWAAKAAWGFMGIGIIAYIAGWSVWPYRISMLFVALTNFEAICISSVLSKSRVDVPSIWHARRLTDQR